MNIKFIYLYRDAANYKSWSEEIFSNCFNIPLEIIKSIIHHSLQDGEYFNAKDWGLPDLHFENLDEEIDHSLHEFHNVEESVSSTTTTSDISDFLNKISCERSIKTFVA